MAKQTVWITGAAGLIGNYLVKTAREKTPQFHVFAPTHRELDLTNSEQVREAFHAQKPALIIHCAAISRTPTCQTNPGPAHKINVEATAMLADLAAEIPFIFCSSDLVFDGRQGHYVETDAPNPLSVYAETKVAAEQVVIKNPRHTIVRLSLNYGQSLTGDRSFNEEMFAALRAGKSCKLFVDEYRSPTPAAVTARALWDLAQAGATGVFHVAAAERLSRFEIGRLLVARHPEFEAQLVPVLLKEYEGAPRAPDTSLDCAKVQQLLTFPLPKFSQWLQGEGV